MRPSSRISFGWLATELPLILVGLLLAASQVEAGSQQFEYPTFAGRVRLSLPSFFDFTIFLFNSDQDLLQGASYLLFCFSDCPLSRLQRQISKCMVSYSISVRKHFAG